MDMALDDKVALLTSLTRGKGFKDERHNLALAASQLGFDNIQKFEKALRACIELLMNSSHIQAVTDAFAFGDIQDRSLERRRMEAYRSYGASIRTLVRREQAAIKQLARMLEVHQRSLNSDVTLDEIHRRLTLIERYLGFCD